MSSNDNIDPGASLGEVQAGHIISIELTAKDTPISRRDSRACEPNLLVVADLVVQGYDTT